MLYWMENVKNDRTCHQSVLLDDDFGGTLDNVNGGLECPADDHGWHGKAVQLRLNGYCTAATTIGIEGLSRLGGCLGMDERMRLCLNEGTCKDCEAWGRTTDLGGEAGEGGGEAAATAGRDQAPPDGGDRGVVERRKRGPVDSVAQRREYSFSVDPDAIGRRRWRGDPKTDEDETSDVVSDPTTTNDLLLLLVVVVIGGVGGESISWRHRAARGGIARAFGRQLWQGDPKLVSDPTDDK